MSWQEYDGRNNLVADWLPWGGLTAPFVLENKDGSFLGIIKYSPLKDPRSVKLKN